MFSASKLPLNIWFLAIYLITQEKNGISALELSRQLGISYNAAWRMKHKLMQAMKERDDETPLSGYIQLDDVYWGGVQRGTRGRGAKGKRPFVAAVSMNGEGHPINMRFSVVTGFKTKELTSWAKAHLTPKSLVISDGLACFKGVEKADVFHHTIVTGGGSDCVKLPYFQWVNTMISNVKNSMHGTYHAINRNIFLVIWESFVLSSIGASILKRCLNSLFTQAFKLHRCQSGCLSWLSLGGNQEKFKKCRYKGD